MTVQKDKRKGEEMKTAQEMNLNDVKTYYKVFDYYEGEDLIGRTQTLQEAREIAKQHYKDCDGECSLAIRRYVYDETVGKYVRQQTEYKIWR